MCLKIEFYYDEKIKQIGIYDEATGGYVLLTGEDIIELLKIGIKQKIIDKIKIEQMIT